MKPETRPFKPQCETEHELLKRKLNRRCQRQLAVRTAPGLGQSEGNIVERPSTAAGVNGERMHAAFRRHVVDIGDRSQATATKVVYAEINQLPLSRKAALVQEGSDSPIVFGAVLQQPYIGPVLQAALIGYCSEHASTRRTLAARPDATVDSLAHLAPSMDPRARMNHGDRKHQIEPTHSSKKPAIFSALISRYESDFAPFLVPVCQSSDQLREMFDKTPNVLGVTDLFVDNPYTPASMLLGIASSPTTHVIQRGAAKRATELLHARAELRESSSCTDDMAP